MVLTQPVITQENDYFILKETNERLLTEAAVDDAVEVLAPSSTVTVGTGTVGTRYINKNYPYVEGLTAGTTKQVDNPNL